MHGNYFNEIFSELFEFLSVFGIFYGIVALLGLALFILGGYAIFEMSKKADIKYPFLGFIPVLQSFALGRIAEKYVKRDGNKSAKFGTILLVLNILQFIISIVFIVFSVIAILSIIVNVEDAIASDLEVTLSMFSSFIPVIISYFILFAVAISYSVFYYVSLWRVFSIFDNHNATLYLVLSIFFSFLAPIFLFVIRNNIPAFDYKSRLGYFELEQV